MVLLLLAPTGQDSPAPGSVVPTPGSVLSPSQLGGPSLGVTLEVALGRGGHRERARRHVLADHRAAAGHGTVPDPDRRHEGVVGAGLGALADDRAVLLLPVVVGEDRARADVGALTDLRVADVGQVRHLGVVADHAVLRLDEGADLAAGAELGPGSQIRERPHGRLGADHGELAVGAYDAGSRADLAVLERRVGADHRVLGHDGRTEQLGAGQDRHVGTQHHVGVDPGGGGVHHRHAVAHPPGDDAAVELPAEDGELGAVVGALRLHDVVDRVRPDREARLAGQPDDVGQVELTLGVVVADPRQRLEQELCVEGEDPAVDLADVALVRRRILLLHDRLDVTVGVAHHPAVAERVGHHPRHDAHRALGRLVLGGERLEARPLQQRGVGGDDQHGAGRAARLDRDPDRARRTVEDLLDRQHGVGHELLDVRTHLVALMTDHRHDLLRLEHRHRGQHVADHAAPADPVQDLHGLGLHPGAATGSQDDHGQVVRRRHERSLRLERSGSPGRSRTYVASPDSKSGGPCRQTNRGKSELERRGTTAG